MEYYCIGHSWILTTLYVRQVFIAFKKNTYFILLISTKATSLQNHFPREIAQLLENRISVAMVLISFRGEKKGTVFV